MNYIRAYAIVNKFNLEHVLSNKYKIVVRWKGHKCSWRIYATRLLGSALFRVSTYCSVHTCIRVETEGGNAYKVTSSRWTSSIIKQKLRKDPNYKPSGIINDLKIHHNNDVTCNLAWRAKEKAHAGVSLLYMPFVSLYKSFVQHCLSFFLISFGRLTVSFLLAIQVICKTLFIICLLHNFI
ncbi:hypothetical protein GIB67_024090 [Kingdonia uniflora]|uniref:Transposase MuDR plant domain-containing protein n=1 Tax=Kingdonia uniflora TaxID=39325 RepID=A0A7J7MMV2_9MAGN|nr:hypothetical protein GIB67_024090 [Kingdonia uniflora]